MRRIIKILAAAVFLLAVSFQTVYATGLEMKVAVPDGINEGDEFAVEVSYEMDMLDSVRGSLEYETDEFEYISGGSSEGNGGVVQIRGNGEGGKAVFTVIFKALKPCDGIITVSTKEAYDLDGKTLNRPLSKVTVTVAQKQAEPVQKTVETEDNEENRSETDITEDDNSSILLISIGITAVLLIVLIIIAAVRRKG